MSAVVGAESGQYDPLITQNNTIVGVPEGEDGEQFYLPDAITDKAVKWIHGVRAQDPIKPWFVYYSTGCAHAPHHVPTEWSEKYRGKFDQGWDKPREETFERQKKLGVIPQDAVLTPRPDLFPAWDSLSDDAKKLYARQMEVYAGYQENADHNVGVLLDAIDEMGELDNALVIYVFGDNGASMEGTITGSFNELTPSSLTLTPEQQVELIEQYGGLDAWEPRGPRRTTRRPGAWAGNTPFQWGKQVGSHLGGTRDGMVVRWPGRIKDAGGRRSQFAHCIDLGPTILEAAGIPQVKVVDGIEQEPMHGRASSTPSKTRTPPTSTPCSIGSRSETGRSTRTVGGPAQSSIACPGPSRRRRWRNSLPVSTTPTTTLGSCTTCRTTSRRRTISPPRTRRSWRS